MGAAVLPEHSAVISGIGQSDVGRALGRDSLDLALDACLGAIEDAGLRPSDIDGVATYPGSPSPFPGFSGAGVYDIADALRLELTWYTGGYEIPAQLGSIVNAVLAIAGGLATHVLCFRSIAEASAQGTQGRASVMTGVAEAERGECLRVSGTDQWTLPFGAASPVNLCALMAQRHAAIYGTTREQLGALAVSSRRYASTNPKAVLRQPFTLDDYLAARMISSPLCLLDCDIPVDGCTAVIVSSVDRVADLRKRPIRLEAMGSATRGRPSWDQRADMTTMAAHDAAEMMWQRTDLKPSDVDFAELYDGFSILTLFWLEALGFCGPGESGPMIEGGKLIAADGALPLNTAGGQMSGGRLHAFGLLHEACAQLRGEAGARQLTKQVEIAAVGAGGGPPASCFLLTGG
ncbi:MAG: thiolase family protein [Acidimicrobiia bacterium]